MRAGRDAKLPGCVWRAVAGNRFSDLRIWRHDRRAGFELLLPNIFGHLGFQLSPLCVSALPVSLRPSSRTTWPLTRFSHDVTETWPRCACALIYTTIPSYLLPSEVWELWYLYPYRIVFKSDQTSLLSLNQYASSACVVIYRLRLPKGATVTYYILQLLCGYAV